VSGSVTNQQISASISHQGRNVTFSAEITLPNTGSAPFPAVFAVDNGFGGVDRNAFLSEGVAVIDFDPSSVAPEGTRQNNGLKRERRRVGAASTRLLRRMPEG
jgi:hypothetical protein